MAQSWAAKKKGAAGIEPAEMLELCVQCPASVLRMLLDCMVSGASTASLSQLSQRLQGTMDATGAGECGLLLVYNDLLESPGDICVYVRVVRVCRLARF